MNIAGVAPDPAARGVEFLSARDMSGRSSILAIALVGAAIATAATARGAPAQSPVSSASAPVYTIAEAIEARDSDREVTVAGRAVVSAGKLQASAFDVAIEDRTGGIRLFTRVPRSDVREGDSVIATGTIKSYRGNTELVLTTLVIASGPRRLIAPHELTIDPPTIAQHAGQLVRVHGRVAGSGRSEGGQWLRLRDAGSDNPGTLTVWVPANHGAPIDLGSAGAEDSVVVTGVVASYQDNADDPVVWQLVPRDAADVQITAAHGAIPTRVLWAGLGVALLLGAVLTRSRFTARRQLHALRETEARYRQLLALLPDAVIVHAGNSILFTNPAAAELLGLTSEHSLVGRPLADFVHPDSLSAFAVKDEAARADSSTTGTPRVRARMLTATGGAVDVDVASSPCVYHDMPATVLLAHDITAQLRYERDLHALALVDELTGLQNRRAFTLFADQELARARRHSRTPVMVFADLDGLKQINDQHGHAAGDTAIRLVASALKSIFRETDIVARWSGDEFVALMVEGSEEASQLIGSRLDAAIVALAPQDLPYVVSASVGATPLDPALPLRDAMERADAELYAQKKRERRSQIRATPLSVDAITQQS